MTTTAKDFVILSDLGKGSYSSVYKVKRISDGKEYALKKVRLLALKDKEKSNALNEVRILASISNEYIISYKEAFLEESTNSLCIIMEFANGGDLQVHVCPSSKRSTRSPGRKPTSQNPRSGKSQRTPLMASKSSTT